MDPERRFRVAVAILLIVVGTGLLIMHWAPSLWAWVELSLWFPLTFVGAGVLLLLVATALGLYVVLVPAAALGGFGIFMFWHTSTGMSLHWAYIAVAALAFLGLGLLVSGLFGMDMRPLGTGAWMIVLSGVLYGIVGTFLGDLSLLRPHYIAFMIALAYLVVGRPRLSLH